MSTQPTDSLPCTLNPEDEGLRFLRNVGSTYSYKMSHPRSPQSEQSLPRIVENFYKNIFRGNCQVNTQLKAVVVTTVALPSSVLEIVNFVAWI
jgi:hypothetical protein